MVKHFKGQQSVANRGKNGIFWDIFFFEDYILEIENNHIPCQLLDFIEITIQDKGKYSTQYNYSILQLEYFFLTTLQRLGSARILLGFLSKACCS